MLHRKTSKVNGMYRHGKSLFKTKSIKWFTDDWEDARQDEKQNENAARIKADDIIKEVEKSYNADKSTHIDISAFCLATHFCIRRADEERNLEEDTLVFFKPMKLRDDVKYIIISATADEEIYKQYFGADRVVFYESKQARYEGTLNQYYPKSWSRTCIDQDLTIFKRIAEKTGIPLERILTFKKYAESGLLGKVLELYFGNTEGVDYLKGLNLNVVGTPYQAEFLYKLFAFSIGLDFDEDAQMKNGLPVTHNGYRFRFTTYENEALRKVHFWMIESELEQAVGRARLLRYDCIVNLFSNFPIRQAVMMADGFI